MGDIMQIFKSFIGNGKNPREIAMQMIGNNKNPMLNNLVKMAENGDYKGVENFARNMLKEQGRDFDTEMRDMQNLIKSFK